MKAVQISSTVKKYPVWPYNEMKKAILGASYELSLTFIGPDRAKRLNTTYRSKDYTPNVLSFPLDEKTGEIYICPAVAEKQAKEYGFTVRGHIAFLFIHGLLHLKGHAHGDTMDKLEHKFVRKFRIK